MYSFIHDNDNAIDRSAIMAISFRCSKITELEEELKVVSNNMKSLEIAEQEVRLLLLYFLRLLPPFSQGSDVLLIVPLKIIYGAIKT